MDVRSTAQLIGRIKSLNDTIHMIHSKEVPFLDNPVFWTRAAIAGCSRGDQDIGVRSKNLWGDGE
jgi:hypothetical protein